jgi:hypothetical protein
MSLMYRIREVDGDDDDIVQTLAELQLLAFFGGAPILNFEFRKWWLVWREAEPVLLQA